MNFDEVVRTSLEIFNLMLHCEQPISLDRQFHFFQCDLLMKASLIARGCTAFVIKIRTYFMLIHTNISMINLYYFEKLLQRINVYL